MRLLLENDYYSTSNSIDSMIVDSDLGEPYFILEMTSFIDGYHGIL